MKNIPIIVLFLFLFAAYTSFAQLTIKDQSATPVTLLEVNDEIIHPIVPLRNRRIYNFSPTFNN